MVALSRWADDASGHVWAPIYLVGSALGQANPRDWDVIAILEDDDFAERFGAWNTAEWTRDRWRWAESCAKASREARRLTGLNVDFRILPKSYTARFDDRPRRRLDHNPTFSE